MTGADQKPTNIHATGLIVAGTGVLIFGPSGSGKSLLALDLMAAATLSGKEVALVADDRVDLIIDEDGGLIMHTPPTIAGMIELRGRGIVKRPYIEKAKVHLIVELVEEFERFLEDSAVQTNVIGVSLPRCPIPKRGVIDGVHQRLLVEEALHALTSSENNENIP